MSETILKLCSGQTKYGLATLFDSNGNVIRQSKISLAELEALGAKGVPSGFTRREWESGLMRIDHKAFDVGDIYVTPREAKVKITEEWVDSRGYIETMIKLAAKEFSGVGEKISVDQSVLDAIDMSKTRILAIDAIQNGVVTWR